MDPDRERLQDDLRGLIAGEVRCDDVFLRMYATDASIFEIQPMAVVRPRTTADVSACVRYAAEHELSVHARGAGTSVTGGPLGRGIVIDFSHSMRRIYDEDHDTVRVQAGVVLAQLNDYLRPSGRMFGPDPSGAEVTTMGGVVSVNRCGSHFPKYGTARDRVVAMQVVLADGSVHEFGVHSQRELATISSESRMAQLVPQVLELLERNASLIDSVKPRTQVNTSGYLLSDTLEGESVNFAKLICGSEGTLGLITEITLRTDPLPAHQGVGMLFFDRVDKAARAVQELARFDLSACDLVDRRLLSIARESDLRYEMMIPSAAEAVLLIGIHGTDATEIRQRLKAATQQIYRKKRLAFDSTVVMDPTDVKLYWRLAHRVLPMLYGLVGARRPLPFVEDIAVPPSELADFVTTVQNTLKKHQVTASLYAHAGQGQLHLRPFLDLANSEDVLLMQRLATDLYQQALLVGGTIAGEHGNGLSRSWYVRRQFPELYSVFRELKRIFDPGNVLNPGKITEPESLQLTKSLRPVSPTSPSLASVTALQERSDAASPRVGLPNPPDCADEQGATPVELLLNWNTAEIANVASSCNGCGACRTQASTLRMCPIFRYAPAEEASPRAKANLMRGIFAGDIDIARLADDQMKEVADLCVNCHQCRLECPAGVDIPKLMIEYKAQYVATNGLPFSDWFLSRLDVLAPWAATFQSFSNFVIGNRRMRWLLERLTRIAQGRKLPRVNRRSFMATARRQRLTKPVRSGGHKVLYFADLYANWFDDSLASAFVSVFQHNGIAIFVDPDQVQCGMSLISIGAVEKARDLAVTNVRLLADAVRQGYHIVTAEPSAALCLTREYRHMFANDDDVELIAENTSEACAYLWRMHQRGQLELDFKPVHMTVGYHMPCHLKALDIGSPGEQLLRLIPGLTVRLLDQGCSGMAGTYGLKAENYRNSLRAGWPLITAIREPQMQIGATECSTCKMQMEQGTSKPTLHPLKLLAYSYGLMPNIGVKLSQQGEEMFVT